MHKQPEGAGKLWNCTRVFAAALTRAARVRIPSCTVTLVATTVSADQWGGALAAAKVGEPTAFTGLPSAAAIRTAALVAV